MKKSMLIISNLLLLLGIEICLSPFVLYWFTHSVYERYIWIIKGPFPFNSFGGGPFQLLIYGGLLITGLVLITVSLIVKRKIRN